jgi:cytochrome c oxidase subunit 3
MSTPGASAATPLALDPDASAGAVVERAPAGKIGMWMFLATDVMGFAGLLITYAILRVRADQWPDTQERLAILQAAAMTAMLVTSSFTMTMAVRAARAHRATARAAWHAATILLGAGFLGGQVIEYGHLATGARPMRLGADLFASTFYAVTGYHGLHVLAGVLILLGLLLAPRARARSLEVAAIFWHFVDLAWIPIFSFVYLLPTS